MFYSQFGEDEWIFNHSQGLPRYGTFCEVGAYDGICGSNTLAFEKEGWRGILIEPDPELARECRAVRRSITISAAVGCPGIGYAGFSSFYRNFQDRGKSKLAEFGPVECQIRVPLVRLDYILSIHGIDHLDLLSIDTEGSELDVWDSICYWHTYPRIVIMEYWTQPNPPAPDPVILKMQKSGYREIHRTEANLIFRKD